MGVLHLLDFSDGSSVAGMCRQGEVLFRVMNMLMPLSTCMGSRPGLRVVKVMRPKFSARVLMGSDQLMEGCSQLTQQHRDGREGGVAKRS